MSDTRLLFRSKREFRGSRLKRTKSCRESQPVPLIRAQAGILPLPEKRGITAASTSGSRAERERDIAARRTTSPSLAPARKLFFREERECARVIPRGENFISSVLRYPRVISRRCRRNMKTSEWTDVERCRSVSAKERVQAGRPRWRTRVEKIRAAVK
jgi:hypothetical protein